MSELTNHEMQKIYYLAKDQDMALLLCNVLREFSPEKIKEIVRTTYFDNGQRITLLAAAAFRGHYKIVNMLVKHFSPNLEQEVAVKYCDTIIEGATALWCAAANGSLQIVKVLVGAGANVNHCTRTKSTALRAACYIGCLDIAVYLTSNGADVNIANSYNNTCLMVAADRGHLDIVTHLLESGADPNIQANCGSTALHYACESGHEKIVRVLLKYNPKFIPNLQGMTPLLVSADHCRDKIVQLLLDYEKVSPLEEIETLELLGASFANDRERGNLELSMKYLKAAMSLRYDGQTQVYVKKLPQPVPAFDNWIESQTMEDLENIAYDTNAIHMEGLAIRERILGADNPEVLNAILYRGAVFADNRQFSRCVDLWLYAVHLAQTKHRKSTSKQLINFPMLFAQMHYLHDDLKFNHIEKVLDAVLFELKNNKLKLTDPHCYDDISAAEEEIEVNLMTLLHLLLLSLRLLDGMPDRERSFRLCKLVYNVLNLGVLTRDRQTLLHLSLLPNSNTEGGFQMSDIYKFPNALVTKLLIQCGADVSAVDKNGNTPLHVIGAYHDISDFQTLHTIIKLLVDAGAHLDAVNNSGKTPLDKAKTVSAKTLLRAATPFSLKCIAARLIGLYQLPYVGVVPVALESFVEIHGGNSFLNEDDACSKEFENI